MAVTGYEKDIDLPGPRPRTRGLLIGPNGAARPIPDADLLYNGKTRLTAGVTWLPWGEISLTSEAVGCAVDYDKDARDLPRQMAQYAFLVYDALTCNKLSGMLDELWARLRHNFAVGLSAAFARQLEFAADGGIGLIGASNYNGDTDADYVPAVGGAATTLRVALNSLEQYLASKLLDSTGMIHMTPGLLSLAAADALVEWDGAVFRTPTGHVVIGDAGHTGLSTPTGGAQGTAAAPWIYATGDVWWALKDQPLLMEAETGEGYEYLVKNIDRPLMETYGLLVFDPNILAAARVTVA